MFDVEWLFFDVGSTLVDESESYNHRIRDAIAGTDISFEQAYQQVVYFAKHHYAEPIKRLGLPLTPWHSEDEFVDPCAESCLRILHQNYKLGIIANQPRGTSERMTKYGLGKHLDLIISSAEENIAKPDLKIFQLALERASCIPERAMMIGDRLDNDIAPAKRLGMKTVWIKQGFGGMATPLSNEETPDFEVNNLVELTELLR